MAHAAVSRSRVAGSRTERTPAGCALLSAIGYRLSARPRSGLTLIELLVVIVLLLILTAVAIPVLAPNVEQRRIREAARLVNTFLSGARTRAMAIGRPVGVQFERLASNPNASMVLTYVEVPESYSGETLDATCTMFFNSTDGKLYARMSAATFSASLLRVGDLLKVDYQGYLYVIRTISGTDLELVAPLNAVLPWARVDPGNAAALNALPKFPYQVIRQPIKAGDAPLQLPEGAVVDMRLSGEGNSWIHINQTNSPMILFSPGGAVQAVFYFDDPAGTGGNYRGPRGPIHLHIGRSDGVGARDTDFPDAKILWNLRDMNNLWVSVGVQAGVVSTTENARVTAVANTILSAPDSTFQTAVGEARAIAATFQSTGGR